MSSKISNNHSTKGHLKNHSRDHLKEHSNKDSRKSNLDNKAKNNEKSNDSSRAKEQKGTQQEVSAFETIKTILMSRFTQLGAVFLFLILLMSVTYDIRTGPVDFEESWTCNMRSWFNPDIICSLKDNLKNSVLEQIQQQLALQIQQEFPNVDQQLLANQVNSQMQEIIRTNSFQGQDLDELVEAQFRNYIRNFQFESGRTYVGDIDTYHYINEAKNILVNGHAGTTLDENGTPIDELATAPQGRTRSSNPEMHSRVITILYQINGVDPQNPTIEDRTQAMFTLSAWLAVLSVIPMFFLLRSMTNTPLSIVGTLMFVTSSIYVGRTQAGYVSTDGYIMLFSLLTVFLLYMALKLQKQMFRIGLAILAGISITLLLWAWSPGTYLVVFTLSALLVPIFYEGVSYLKSQYKLYQENKEIKSNKDKKQLFSISELSSNFTSQFKAAIVAGVYFVTANVLQIIFFSRELVYFTLNDILRRIDGLAGVQSTNIWPNVLSSVAELRNTSFNSILDQLLVGASKDTALFFITVGLLGLFMFTTSHISFKKLFPQYNSNVLKWGMYSIGAVYYFIILLYFSNLTVNYSFIFLGLLFLPIMIGLILRIFDEDIKESDVFMVSLISAWFAGGIFMSLNGVRFLLILYPAFVLLFILGLYKFYTELGHLIKLEFENMKVPVFVFVISFFSVFVLLSVFSPQLDRSYALTNSNIPNFDDGWYELMDFARENTTHSAIISSWWDFGHFFRAVGQRGVYFDGATQQTPAAYWVGNWLLTDDEDRAVNIMRMLSCSLNQGFEYVDEVFVEEMNDESRGVHAFNVVDELVNLNKEEKIEYLENYSRFDFSQQHIDDIMNLVHCDEPRQTLAVASGDMIGKAGVWAHWGLWNPTKKYVLDNYQQLSVEEISSILEIEVEVVNQMVQELQSIDSRAQNLGVSRTDLRNQWLAPYPSYLGNPFECQFRNEVVNCQDQFIIDLSNRSNISVQGQLTDSLTVSRLIIPTMFGMEIIELNDREHLDILLTPGEGTAQLLPAQYPLGNSMFTKLYFLQGYDTTQFDLLKQVQTQTASRVFMYDVNFDEVQRDDSGLTIDMDDLEFEEVIEEAVEEAVEIESVDETQFEE
ncbi:MAG: STT3 domain-containing protein [Candidatus Woesearchaeota archaeon]